MQTSKLDLYKTEWLDLVFEKRNKAYGAYELRQHYGDTMSKAMGGTFLSLAIVIAVGLVFHKPIQPVTTEDHGFIVILPPPPVVIPPKLITPPKSIIKTSPPINMTKFVPFVVTPQPVVQEPPRVIDIKGAVGPMEVKDAKGGDAINVDAVIPGDGGPTSIAPPSNVPVDAGSGSLDVMPEPFGGAGAWAKFLQRNIRYPSAASETGATGKVWLTFIIERDGKISNIEVVRPAGFGFDEEATRVLKLAPAWKPGKQNGQAVRVKYTIPINFQLSDN